MLNKILWMYPVSSVHSIYRLRVVFKLSGSTLAFCGHPIAIRYPIRKWLFVKMESPLCCGWWKINGQAKGNAFMKLFTIFAWIHFIHNSLFCVCSLCNQFGDTFMNDGESCMCCFRMVEIPCYWWACVIHNIQVISLAISRDEIVIFEQPNIDTRFIYYGFETDWWKNEK